MAHGALHWKLHDYAGRIDRVSEHCWGFKMRILVVARKAAWGVAEWGEAVHLVSSSVAEWQVAAGAPQVVGRQAPYKPPLVNRDRGVLC